MLHPGQSPPRFVQYTIVPSYTSKLKPSKRWACSESDATYASAGISLSRKSFTNVPRLMRASGGASAATEVEAVVAWSASAHDVEVAEVVPLSGKFVRAANRPPAVVPSHMPPAFKSFPAAMVGCASSADHTCSGAEGLARTSSRLAVTTSGCCAPGCSENTTRHILMARPGFSDYAHKCRPGWAKRRWPVPGSNS